MLILVPAPIGRDSQSAVVTLFLLLHNNRKKTDVCVGKVFHFSFAFVGGLGHYDNVIKEEDCPLEGLFLHINLLKICVQNTLAAWNEDGDGLS